MIDELFEYGVYLALLVALAIPLSAYLNKVMAGQKTVLSRVLVPVENAVYRCIRVDKSEDMGWKRYLVSAFAFSAICLVGLFAILMLQGLLPLNPEGIPGMSWDLAFNTAVSFVTNTNWQAYSGESALSYFSQAIGLTVQNFVTPAVGLGVLFALFRGIVSEGNPGLGNFWVDVTRAVLFVLIPLSLVVTMIDVQQGSPQNFNEYETVQLLEPVGVTADGSIVDADDPAAVETIDQATVPMGPQASQVAIKQLGTNGGGYNGVNSASALENPTPLTNLVQCLSLLLIPVAGAAAALFALIVARPIIHLRGDYLLIVTIGIVEIVRIALINDVFGLTGGANGIFGIARPELFGIKIRKAIQFYYLIWIMVGLTVLLFHWLSESRFGRALNCIKEDDTAAEGCGMDVAHLKLMAFVIGAFWAGMAGNLFAAKMTIISPSSFTFWESVVVFAVVILSGGSQIGVLLGTFLIVALPEMFRDFASARMLVFGLAMMIMMVVRPQGLLPPSPRRYDVRRLLRRTRDFSSPVAPRTARKEGAA